MVAESLNRSQVERNDPHHKKGKKMTPTVATQKAIAKKRVFDLDKFEKVTIEKEYEQPKPFTDPNDVLSLDPARLLAFVNEGQKRQAWKDARNSIPGASPKVVNQMVNVFRMLPPYVDMAKEDDAASRKVQTQAIYAFIRSNESILNSLKEAAARQTSADEDEEDESGE